VPHHLLNHGKGKVEGVMTRKRVWGVSNLRETKVYTLEAESQKARPGNMGISWEKGRSRAK